MPRGVQRQLLLHLRRRRHLNQIRIRQSRPHLTLRILTRRRLQAHHLTLQIDREQLRDL